MTRFRPSRSTPAAGPNVRWSPQRKAQVVREVRCGAVAYDDALAEHELSCDELDGWITRFRKHGEPGLSVTRLQEIGQ